MSSQHRDPALTVRPPADALSTAQAVLDARSLEMRGFITACLTAVAADPDDFLGRIAEHWPAQKKRGRPPRDEAEQAERPTLADRALDATDGSSAD